MNSQNRFSNLKTPMKNLLVSGLVAAGALTTAMVSSAPANAQNSPVSPAPTTPMLPLDIDLGGTPTTPPTPIATPTPTPIATPTPTPIATPTPTPIVTPTPTPPPTPITAPTPPQTVTPTPTPTPPLTETPTPIATPIPETIDRLAIFDNWPLRRAREFSIKRRLRYFRITLGDMVRYKLTGTRNLGPGGGQPIRWYFDRERGEND